MSWVAQDRVEDEIKAWYSPFKSALLKKIWTSMKAYTFWAIWKERNRRIFQDKKRNITDLWPQIKLNVQEYLNTKRNKVEDICEEERYLVKDWNLIERGQAKDIIDRSQVKWSPPPMGWVKLNFDGAAKGNPGEAGAGGIIRDKDGHCIGAYTEYLGITTNHQAEMRAMWKGLTMLTSLGKEKCIIEGDSLNIINMIKGTYKADWRNEALIRDAKQVLGQFQEVQITHIYREGNKMADGLANRAVRLKETHDWLEGYPEELGGLQLNDVTC